MTAWMLLSQAGNGLGETPAGLAKEVSSVLLLVGLVVVVLLGLGAIAMVLMMGGRLRRQVRDSLPPAEPPPNPMWPLQVPPDDEENREDQ